MVQSQYISDILELLLDGDEDGLLAKQQLPFIADNEYEYTGGGLFVNFNHAGGILEFKLPKNDLVLHGVKIATTEYPIEADATLFFTDGLIGYLEIWCYAGDYPKQDLTKYTLTQVWENSPNRTITTEI